MLKRIGSVLLTGFALTSMMACGGGGSSSSSEDFGNGSGTTKSQAIENFVNNVVLDIYGRLDLEAQGLLDAVNAFVANPNETTLAAARQAWVKTRIPWEESETALFGPVDFRGFDPALDSWPVNRVDLEAVLASNTALSVANVANFDSSVKGYHTIEYLLFRPGQTQTAAGFNTRRFQYLQATTQDLRNVASLLLRSWTQGLDGARPYAEEFVSAGQGSTTYPSEESALEEVIRAMITIADEVANGKIADPFDTRNTELVESQFSYNSIADFTSNIRGIQIAHERSLSGYLVTVNAGLDSKLRAEINAAIAALGQIPQPFRNAILDSANDGKIIAAQEAIRQIQRTLENDVIPLIIAS